MTTETITDVVQPKPLMQPLHAYRAAYSGNGPLAAEWSDKPTRLVYDLLAALLLRDVSVVELNDYWRGLDGIGQMSTIWADLRTRHLIVECLIQKLEWEDRLDRL